MKSRQRTVLMKTLNFPVLLAVLLTLAPTVFSQSARELFERGNSKCKKRDFDGALADYNRAIELRPDYAQAYNLRGAAKKAKGDLDGALADCNRAIELKPITL
jgi:tetratricopeptide (TPR) repeat protein